MDHLNNAFVEIGYSGTPRGLVNIFNRIERRANETAEQCRRRVYRRLFGILWFGNKVGQGNFRGKAVPTYVYPEEIKDAIRERIDVNVRDYDSRQTILSGTGVGLDTNIAKKCSKFLSRNSHKIPKFLYN